MKNFYRILLIASLITGFGTVVFSQYSWRLMDVSDTFWTSDDGSNIYRPGTGGVTIGSSVVPPSATQLSIDGGGVHINQGASYDVWIQGGSVSSGNARNLALLGNKSSDRLYLNYGGEYTGGVYIQGGARVYGDNSDGLRIGTNMLTGSWGNVETFGTGLGSWEGYSIGGRFGMYESGGGTFGLYNNLNSRWVLRQESGLTQIKNRADRNVLFQNSDTVRLYNENDELALYCIENSYCNIYYNNSTKIRTESGGARTYGNHRANAFVYISDERRKNNIKTTKGLESILDLRGVDFVWKESGKKSTGLVAQEVEKVLPHLVHTDDEGYKSVDYASLVGPLIQAVKEQQEMIEQLRERIDNIENK